MCHAVPSITFFDVSNETATILVSRTRGFFIVDKSAAIYELNERRRRVKKMFVTGFRFKIDKHLLMLVVGGRLVEWQTRPVSTT